MAGLILLQFPLQLHQVFIFIFYFFTLSDIQMFLQRVFESTFVGRRCVVKERFSKKYRHPSLDSKITLKRLNAVGSLDDMPICYFISI